VDLAQKNRVVEAANLSLQSKQKAYESTKSGYLPTLSLNATLQNSYKETPISPRNLVQATKNTIALDVSRLYFEYLSFEAHKESIEQEIQQLQAELKRLQMYYQTGSVTKDEVDKIDSRLKTQRVALSEIEIERERVLHTLEYYTDENVEAISAGSHLSVSSAFSDVETRPDIKVLESQTKALMSDAQATKSANLPTLNFQNTYTHTEFFFADKANESPFIVKNQNVAAINVEWNIFDFGAISEAYESKQFDYLSQRASLEFETNKASVEQRLAKREVEILEFKLEATEASLKAASETYELIKLKYQNGTIDNVAYLESLSEKQAAFYAHEKAKNDLEIKKAELLYYSGKTIKEFL